MSNELNIGTFLGYGEAERIDDKLVLVKLTRPRFLIYESTKSWIVTIGNGPLNISSKLVKKNKMFKLYLIMTTHFNYVRCVDIDEYDEPKVEMENEG